MTTFEIVVVVWLCWMALGGVTCVLFYERIVGTVDEVLTDFSHVTTLSRRTWLVMGFALAVVTWPGIYIYGFDDEKEGDDGDE